MNKMKSIIVDIDGTLANNSKRLEHLKNKNPHETTEEEMDNLLESSRSDPPVEWCQNLIKLYNDNGYQIIFVTGRSEKYKDITTEWLNKHIDDEIVYILHMRNQGDKREDDIIKYEIYKTEIEPNYKVEFVLEDRDNVVEMYREKLDIPCFQVIKGVY